VAAPLEDNQLFHNRAITATSNNSGSNDPSQHKHDLNEKMIKSAGAFAAGQTLGLSEEETLAAMSRQLRRQQRKDDTVTMDDVRRQFAQAGNSLVDVGAPEIKGVGYEELPEVDPFGQDQGQYYDYKPDDAQYEQQQLERMQESMFDMEDRDTGSRRYDRAGNVVLRSGVSPEDYDDLAAETEQIIGKRKRDSVAPNSVMRDALNRLEGARAEQAGFQSLLSRVLGGGTEAPGSADVRGRLEQYVNAGPLQREADAALAQELNDRDLAAMSGRRAAYNNIKAQIEAEQIGETMYRPSSVFPGAQLPAVTADRNLAGIAAANPAQFPAAGFNSAGIAFDPATGNPIGMQGPAMVTANNEPSAVLNAPMTTRNWMVDKQPEYSEGGRTFGNYPQTDVTGATTLFADRIRQVEGFGNVSPNIRSIDELQRAADIMIGQGGSFTTREPIVDASGRTVLKSVRQQTPDIRGVLNKLRYTPAQEAQLANAMYQLEVAKQTEINQQGKQQYFTRTGPGGSLQPTTFQASPANNLIIPAQPDARTPGGAGVYFGSPEAMAKGTRSENDGAAPVARIRPGQTIEGRDIGTAFRGLREPGARQPFIGAVETVDSMGRTGVETNAGPGYLNRYNTTGKTEPSAIERTLRSKEEGFQRTKAKKNRGRIQPVDETALRGKVVKAQLTEERAKRDAKKRREQERTISQYTMANPRNVSRVPRRFG